MTRRIGRLVVAGASLWFVSACKGSTESRGATSISLSSTTVRLDAIGATASISAAVLAGGGDTLSGAVVTWTSSSPAVTVTAGAVNPTTVTAVSAGTATVTATSGSAMSSVVVEVIQTPLTMLKVSGDGQSVPISSPLTSPLKVKLTDRLGSPVAGQAIAFAVSAGGGSVTPATATTDATGIASASWTLGSRIGSQNVTATSTVLGTETFTATGTAGAGVPAAVLVSQGISQAAMVGTTVPTPPSVVVRDGAGAALAGATVVFTVASGGGTITNAITTTDGQGTARVGSWTLGSGGPNTLTATVPGLNSESGVATFTGFGCAGGGEGTTGYAITLCQLTTMTTAQRNAFTAAAARWSAIISDDVQDVPGTAPQGQCGTASPTVNFLVDDIVIFASVETIDGPGKILAQSNYCFFRVGSGIPTVGRMRFDVADLASVETGGTLNSVILHEMGHVLGVGTAWSPFGLIKNPVTTGGPTLDSYYSGPAGLVGFNAIGGATYTGGLKVPLENNPGAGDGTYNVHWRESVLANELMTAFISGTTQPLSLLTARSLEDLGYVINPAAVDPFFLTLSVVGVGGGRGIDLRGDVDTAMKRYGVDERGRVVVVR